MTEETDKECCGSHPGNGECDCGGNGCGRHAELSVGNDIDDDLMPTNRERADHAWEVVRFYNEDPPGENRKDSEGIVDLLADLMHLCEEEKYDFEDMLRVARDHFVAEREESV